MLCLSPRWALTTKCSTWNWSPKKQRAVDTTRSDSQLSLCGKPSPRAPSWSSSPEGWSSLGRRVSPMPRRLRGRPSRMSPRLSIRNSRWAASVWPTLSLTLTLAAKLTLEGSVTRRRRWSETKIFLELSTKTWKTSNQLWFSPQGRLSSPEQRPRMTLTRPTLSWSAKWRLFVKLLDFYMLSSITHSLLLFVVVGTSWVFSSKNLLKNKGACSSIVRNSIREFVGLKWSCLAFHSISKCISLWLFFSIIWTDLMALGWSP